jgi:3-oxoadipate enol-lactonase
LIGEEDLPIVLLHGTMGKSEDWSRVVRELSNFRTVIRPNYIERFARGSTADESAIKNLADEVVAAVREQGKEHFDLVGNSLGAAVATCLAAEYPDMVRSLVLVSGFSHGGDARMNLQFKLWLRLASTDKVAFTKLLLMSGLSPGFLSGFEEPTLNGITEDFVASTDWHPVEPAIKVDLSVDVREYAARVTTPTLLITAKHDQIVPPAYSEHLVPDAKTLELDSGHLIFLERPIELASAILLFCQSQAGAVSSN